MVPPPTVQERASSSSTSSKQSSSKSRDKSKEKAPDLLCRVRFSNTLPDIPFDPKFSTCAFVDLNRFVEYKQTSLEKNYKHEILTEPDLGVNIDLINPDTYSIDYDSEIKMDPADERLLEEEQTSVHDSKRSQHHSKIVPWMRKTEYISSEFNRFGTSSDRQETKLGYNIKRRLQEENLYRDRSSQLDAINKTFEDVKRPVTQHYSKPGVTAIQELPLLPDFDVIFDTDPAPVGSVVAQDQMDKMSQALIRGMMDESGEQFVAYFLPTEETLEKRKQDAEAGQQYDPEAEYDYKLSREYNWTVKNKASKGYEENYFLVMRGDGVYYNELETRVRLSRRRAKEGQHKVTNSRLLVNHREQTDQEVAVQDARLMQLQMIGLEEEEEAEEPEAEPQTQEETEPTETEKTSPKRPFPHEEEVVDDVDEAKKAKLADDSTENNEKEKSDSEKSSELSDTDVSD